MTGEPADITGNGPYGRERGSIGDGQAKGEGGIGARVKGAAKQAADAVQGFSQYVRSHDVQTMRTDLETRVREHPIASVAIGFGVGFLLAKLLRR